MFHFMIPLLNVILYVHIRGLEATSNNNVYILLPSLKTPSSHLGYFIKSPTWDTCSSPQYYIHTRLHIHLNPTTNLTQACSRHSFIKHEVFTYKPPNLDKIAHHNPQIPIFNHDYMYTYETWKIHTIYIIPTKIRNHIGIKSVSIQHGYLFITVSAL